jgi:predicted DNA-binding transcriptional regulator AlpA
MTTGTTVPEDPECLGDYPLVLRPKHVRDYLGRGLRQTYQLFHRDNFPSFKIGGSLGVRRADFREWLDEQKKSI